MLKKSLSLAVALAMCLALSTVVPPDDDVAEDLGFEGDGTEENPYLIETAEKTAREYISS